MTSFIVIKSWFPQSLQLDSETSINSITTKHSLLCISVTIGTKRDITAVLPEAMGVNS